MLLPTRFFQLDRVPTYALPSVRSLGTGKFPGSPEAISRHTKYAGGAESCPRILFRKPSPKLLHQPGAQPKGDKGVPGDDTIDYMSKLNFLTYLPFLRLYGL